MSFGIYTGVNLLKHLKIVKSAGEELKETNMLITWFWWVKTMEELRRFMNGKRGTGAHG